VKVCFGIDISGGNPVVVRAERVRGKVVTSVVSTDVIGGGAFVAGSLSVRESFVRWLETPFAAEGKARKVLPTLLDIQLPFPLEECSYDFIAVRSEEETVKALAVGARADDVKSKIIDYEKLGVDVQVLDQEGVALWERGLEEFPVSGQQPQQPRIMVNMNGERSTVVLGCGDEFISAHSVLTNDGGRVSRLLEVGLKGMQNGRTLWLFSGENAEDEDLVESFLSLAGDHWRGQKEIVQSPVSFLAKAIAARACMGTGCNLRSGDLMHLDIRLLLKKELLAPVFALAAAGLLLIASNVVAVTVLGMKENRINTEFKDLANKVAGYRLDGAKGVDALKKVRSKVDERGVAARPFLVAFGRSLTGLMREIIEEGKKSDLKYEVISVSHVSEENGGLLVKGTAPSWNGCDELAGMLRRKGYMVKIDRSDALADERIPFVLRSGVTK
jgi:hypothetical protein